MKTKKVTSAAMLVALGVAGSYFIHFPIGVSKCTPVQHIVNVFAGVILGRNYAVLTAVCISLIRNILGIGTVLAFPGSVIGAFLAGTFYQVSKRKLLAAAGEVVGTGIIGATIAFPLAKFVLGKDVTAFFFVVPFMINAGCGSIIAYILLKATELSGIGRRESAGRGC